MIYQLLIKLDSHKLIKIGKLGNHFFRKGFYIYTGSAKTNFSNRIFRHIKKHKRKKWHIDFLREKGKIIQVKKYQTTNECMIHKKILIDTKGIELIKKFGASDCKCYSHLIYTGEDFKLIK